MKPSTQRNPSIVNQKQKSLSQPKLKKIGYALYKSLQNLNQKQIKLFSSKFFIDSDQWMINQQDAEKEKFSLFLRQMISAIPVYLSVNEKPLENHTKTNKKISLYKIFIHIEFHTLKTLCICLQSQIQLQWITWLDAPHLQSLSIATSQPFHNIKTLARTNNRQLSNYSMNIRNDKCSTQTFQLNNFSRMKFYRSDQFIRQDHNGGFGQSLESLQSISFSHNYHFSKISADFAKFQIKSLQSFYEQKRTISLSETRLIRQSKLYEVLNRKFKNYTIDHNQCVKRSRQMESLW